MEAFETKACDYFGEIIINKALIHQAGFGSRGYSDLCGGNGSFRILSAMNRTLTDESRERIAAFMQKIRARQRGERGYQKCAVRAG